MCIATFDTNVTYESERGSTWLTFLPSGVLSGHGHTASDPTFQGLSGSAMTTGAHGCFFSDPRQVLGVTGAKSALRVSPSREGDLNSPVGVLFKLFLCGSLASVVWRKASLSGGWVPKCPLLLCAQPMVAQCETWGWGFSWR